jgi:hypothetical protein
VQRADVLFDQAGQRVGSFVAQARMRLQALAAQSSQAAQDALNRSTQAMNHDSTGDGHADTAMGATQQSGADAPPPMERAEVLVDAAGQRLSAFGQVANQRLQVVLAYLREEGEDIWAEAQSIRRPDTPIHQEPHADTGP